MKAKQRSSPTCTQFSYKGRQLRLFVLMASLSLACVTPSSAQLYRWTDPQGTLHLGNDAGEVAEASRRGLAVSPVGAARAGGKSAAAPLSPSRVYTAQSQGAFAQRLAQDLGLIQQRDEDALGPLSGMGIAPTGYWHVTEPLTAEMVEEIVAATRRAAATARLALSADGAEAVVRQVAVAFLPAPVPLASPPAVEGGDNVQPVVVVEPEVIIEEPPPVIVEQAPAQVIEVIQPPVYVPVPAAGWSGRRPKRGLPASPEPLPQHSHPGPSHMPFGTSHMPFGTGHSKNPFLSGLTDRSAGSRERGGQERKPHLRMP
jgi:Domain of unknown function (DUF4124)